MSYRAAVFALIWSLCASEASFAQTASCKPVFDAMLKEAQIPHHAISTRNGQTAGESISTTDAMYVKVRGVWQKSPLTPQAYLAQQQENLKDVSTATCQQLPDETLDGAATSVYLARYDMKDFGLTEAKVWIAKSSGLPVRTDETMRGGEHVSEVHRFDYSNITAPVK